MAKADSNQSKEFNPLAVNITRLQKYIFNTKPYKLTLEDVIFFEYMVVKGKSFKYKPFFHSSKTISEETGIKKSKLATIIIKFESLGLISVEVKGYPKVKYFSVDYAEISKNLENIYQFTENGKLLAENGKLLSYFGKLFTDFVQQKEHNKELKNNNNKKPKEKEKESDSAIKKFFYSSGQVNDFITKIEKTFNSRRNEATPGKHPNAVLPFKKEVFPFITEALSEMGEQLVTDAWLVYVDRIIRGELHPEKVLKYFFSKKDGVFDVIGNLGEQHNLTYVFRSYSDKE